MKRKFKLKLKKKYSEYSVVISLIKTQEVRSWLSEQVIESMTWVDRLDTES